MKINDINPYLRFAQTFTYESKSKYLCAVDYHFYFILSDGCLVEIDDEEYSLDTGAVIIIPPGTKYGFDAQGEIKLVSINFDYTRNFSYKTKEIHPMRTDEFKAESIIERVDFEDYAFFNKTVVVKNTDYLSEQINSIVNEFIYKKKLYEAAASSTFKNIIISIAREMNDDKKSMDVTERILDYIHQNYSKDIDNKILSDMAGYHSYHLNRLMKNATGTTLRQYLINYRIETAKRYLRDTNYQISKISELCGYNNFCNFSSDFKRKTGLTPSVYRLKVQHLL